MKGKRRAAETALLSMELEEDPNGWHTCDLVRPRFSLDFFLNFIADPLLGIGMQ